MSLSDARVRSRIRKDLLRRIERAKKISDPASRDALLSAYTTSLQELSTCSTTYEYILSIDKRRHRPIRTAPLGWQDMGFTDACFDAIQATCAALEGKEETP
ncbi:hypothetical protein J2129_002743 [Methanofollis sp. W23]|nr:hypothetical protein [Methanofollis sp. W23]